MSWRCACGAENIDKSTACEFCGREHAVSTPVAGPPVYREFPVRVWRDSKPTDRCPEEGCDKTVAQHIEAFKRYGDRMGLRIVKL